MENDRIGSTTLSFAYEERANVGTLADRPRSQRASQRLIYQRRWFILVLRDIRGQSVSQSVRVRLQMNWGSWVAPMGTPEGKNRP